MRLSRLFRVGISWSSPQACLVLSIPLIASGKLILVVMFRDSWHVHASPPVIILPGMPISVGAHIAATVPPDPSHMQVIIQVIGASRESLPLFVCQLPKVAGLERMLLNHVHHERPGW